MRIYLITFRDQIVGLWADRCCFFDFIHKVILPGEEPEQPTADPVDRRAGTGDAYNVY